MSRTAPFTTESDVKHILPGAVIGILGGGPAGRSIALVARKLGYRVRVLDADPSCLVGSIAERSVVAPIADAEAAAGALGGCDVVTASVEHVPMASFAAIQQAGVPIRPSPHLVGVAQDRVLERDWLAARGIPLVPWRSVSTLEESFAAFFEIGGPCLLKSAMRRPNAPRLRLVSTVSELVSAWYELGGGRCAIERLVTIDRELCVVVARSPDGTVASYRPAESSRKWQSGTPRLEWSVLPAGGPEQHASKARRLATSVAERLSVEGLLAVEMFLLSDGRMVVNELVPCPHPTFVAAEHAYATGQYEQLVRAICGLPLGSTSVIRPVAVAPIFGDSWCDGTVTRIGAAIGTPGVSIHADVVVAPSADQYVGHLAASASTPELAVGRVMHASARLAGLETDSQPTPEPEETAKAARIGLYEQWRRMQRRADSRAAPVRPAGDRHASR